MLFKKCIIFLFLIVPAFCIDLSYEDLKKAEGFQFRSFSSKNGYPYFKLEYKDASTERPKVGFLKFGLAFLKIKDLKITIDLRHTEAISLQSKWDELVKNKAIKYASMDRIYLNLIDKNGLLHTFQAPKAKFISSGEFRLWGKVSYLFNNEYQEFERVFMTQDKSSKKIVIKRTENDSNPLVLNFTQ